MILGPLLTALTLATPISLAEVRKESRDNAQTLMAALEQDRAAQQVQLARSAILPQLSLNGTIGAALYGPQRTFSTVPETDASGSIVGFTQRSVDVNTHTGRGAFELSASLTQLLYDGGAWWSRLAQAGALADAEQGRTKEQRLAAEYEGVRRFYELLRAQEIARLLEESVKRSEAQVARATALFEAGRANRGDVLAARVNAGNDRLELVRQQSLVAEAQGNLAVWLARPGSVALVATAPEAFAVSPDSTDLTPSAERPTSGGVEPSISDSGTPSLTLEEALSAARERRPLLEALTSRLRAADLATELARAPYLPSVAVEVSAGRYAPSPDPFFTDLSRQNFVQGGLNLRWNLFAGFKDSAALQQTRIAKRQVTLEFQQAERELEAQIRTALVNHRAQLAAEAISRENLTLARAGLELAETRFEEGAASTLEVRDAQLKLSLAELQLLQNRINVEVSRAALERAVGPGGSLE